jgi:hypothetical protein
MEPENMMPDPTHASAIEYATKADLRELRAEIRADLAELKADLARQNNTTLIALTAIFGGLVTILKLFG